MDIIEEDKEVYDTEYNSITISSSGVEIESKITGEIIYLDDEETLELYEVIRQKLLSNHIY